MKFVVLDKDGNEVDASRFLVGSDGEVYDDLQIAQGYTVRFEPDYQKLYHELLFEVATKNEGESRHETALRYIRNAESGGSNAPVCGVTE